ncbi:MAG: extracellular solute-binding protein [Thalassobaculaceae bacterium]|nr:extracellular solute-binding protein [Thalassobaculaceae bacterium]
MTIARLAAIPMVAALLISATVPVTAQDHSAPPRHGLAMHGDLKYGPDFSHLDYANPDAPVGGLLTMEASGTFDSFNPFIIRGTPAAGIGLIYDTLLESTSDEAFSEYARLAESVEMPEDRSWVAFNLNPSAKWHDGTPVTAEDVTWTFNTLVEKGAPFYAAYYGDVETVEAVTAQRVLFKFKDGMVNQELPLILGQLIILPKHWWADRDFSAPLTDLPLGSGPYKATAFEFGRSVVYERVSDYWGADVPVMRGRYNWGTVRYEYFRDRDVATEAFKAGAFDLRAENSSKRWATAYDFPAKDAGMVIQEALPHDRGSGMQGFAMNIRRPIFADRAVRHAISLAFDFEWTNKALLYDAYTRTESYFANTELAATGLPSAAELTLLEPLRDQLPPEVFTEEFHTAKTDGSGNARANLREGLRILRDAGWSLQDGVMKNADGLALDFEILLGNATSERFVLPFAKNLERLGAKVSVRTVDPVQYQNRVRDFDFDMTIGLFPQSLSPGNEQMDFWHSTRAVQPGSRNIIGISDPAIDALVRHVVTAQDRDALITATRALDRALLWGFYVVPHFHSRSDRIIYWNRFGRPDEKPRYEIGFSDTWWVDPEKDAAVRKWRRSSN